MKEQEASKETIVGFVGGLDIDLNKKIKGKRVGDELVKHLDELLTKELDNQEGRIDNIKRWQRQYKGYRDKKSFPFLDSANVVTPITRSNVDTIYVRIEDDIYGRDKFWLFKPTSKEYMDFATKLEDSIDWYQKNVLHLKDKTQSPLLQCVKVGSGIIKVGYTEKKRTCYRYANEEEEIDDTIKKYSLKGTKRKAIKYVKTTVRGADVFPIDRLHWVMSADADSPDDAYMCGFYNDYRKAQLDTKVNQGLYYKDAVDKIKNPDEYDEVEKDRAEISGKELETIEYTKPYKIWELWTRFDVDGDGEEDEIVITFHQDSLQILRAIYTPLFSGRRPFTVFKGYPTEFSPDGEGICEILEKLQMQIDTLENQRLDRQTEINAPMVFVSAGSGLKDYKINPGKVQEVEGDLEQAIRIERFPDVYYSTEREEDRLIEMANRACGIAPENLGQPTSERPVFKEAFARMQEAQKKFKSLKDNIIRGFERTGMLLLENFAQYQPVYEYSKEIGGKWETQSVDFPIEDIYDGLTVTLQASTEIVNQDMRRDINMSVYHMLSDFMTKRAGMAQAIIDPLTPAQFKKYLIAEYEIGTVLMQRILKDSDQPDAENMARPLNEVINLEEAMKRTAENAPPMPPEQGQPTSSQPTRSKPSV